MHRRLRSLQQRTLFLALLVLAAALPAGAAESFQRTEDIIYGRKHGVALTMDVFRPERPNGFGILLLVSGGWYSSKEAIDNPGIFQPLRRAFLQRGYTVFAVAHGSQPKYTIPEITQDIHRAVRFVRSHAAKWGVDPDRLGVTGASAGGHLSLTIATQGGPGRADARDPVDRASSAVQAVACFYPPTDFLNYGRPGEDAVGVGVLADFKGAFGPRAETAESRQAYGREISPITFITKKLPPTLIIHGDADRLVPLQQAESFVKKAQAAGATAKLVVREGKAHGWPELPGDIPLLADWFDEHLRGTRSRP